MPINEEDPGCRLYLVTPPRIELATFPSSLAQALDGGDVACLQLRLKDAQDDDICRAVEALLPLCRGRGVPLILNDRPDLARQTGCDGVHIGQEDATYADAREAVGDSGIVGVTCHDSRHLGMEAAEQGADYVAFGAFFATETKQASTRAPVEILQWWSDIMVVPVVAIGGITPDNCAPLVRAGADFLALVSAVWDHPDGPGKAVEIFNAVISESS
ncbi:MAG: thiamine phosphate synthase [Proteobacteria bacterium]|nr:thiamine phosphate synthase [Pseudomonadota bacterium]MDA1023074.1 thiamine phosphate synthase [Pseudomonadota bacterium]